MSRASCMGGWCTDRESCELHVKADRNLPVERLCEHGKADSFEPIRIVRKAGTWERGAGRLLRPAAWLDSMVPA